MLFNNNSGPMQFTACLISCPSSSFPVTELVAAMPNNYMESNRFAEAGRSLETRKNLTQTHTHTKLRMEVAPPPKNVQTMYNI